MSFLDLDLKGFEKVIFGRNENLSRIQKLYAQAMFYQKSCVGKICHNVSDNIDIFNELEAEIDKVTPNPDSPNYSRFIAMKALALLLYCCPHKEKPEKVEKAIALLEPIKTAPEATLAYIKALVEMDRMSENRTNVKYLLMAEAQYDRVVKQGISIFSIFQVLGGVASHSNEENRIVMNGIFRKFSILKNDMKQKYLLPSLKSFFNMQMFGQTLGIECQYEQIVFLFLTHIECLIKTNHFAQLDHLLSIFMFNLVKAGREVVDEEARSKIHEAKALVSYWYAAWAENLLYGTHAMAINPDYASENPIRTEMIRFEEFIEPGVEIYERQFPIEFISTEKEWKKVQKKGKLWCQRSVDYFEKCKTFSDKFKSRIEATNCLLKRFENYQCVMFY